MLTLLFSLSGVPGDPVHAQLDPAVADDVAAATVLLSALITQTENGITTDEKQCFLGSGSVVSPDGRYILTNSHVVNLLDLATSYAADTEVALLEDNPGRQVTVQVKEIAVSVVEHADGVPDRRYRAEVVKQDETLDLAVLRITGDSPGRDHERPLRIPHLALDLAAVQPGQAVTLIGYPALGQSSTDNPGCAPVPGDRSIQMFPGTVSGFAGPNLDQLVVTASGSGGMSGGSAVNAAGHLIGVPAEIQQMAAGGVVEVIPIEQAQVILEGVVPTGSPTPLATNTPIPLTPSTPSPTPSPTVTETATATAADTPPTATAALSGNLAYGVEIAGQWDIYAYDFASNTSAPLAADPNSDELAPSFSHDGSRIAFVSDASGSHQAWVADADGANPILVTDGPAAISYVAWTADDERLIVTAFDEASDGYLAIVPATGGALQPFGPPGIIGFATVADDGRVAFVQFREGDHDILIADPAGEVFAALAETGEEEDAASISPDGSRVAYQVGLKGARRIEIVSTQGGPVERVGPYSRDDSNPVWSPDGMMIAYAAASEAATGGNADEIWVVTPGGAQPVRLDLKMPSFDQLWYLSWGPSPTPASPTRVPAPTSTPSPVPVTPSPSPTPPITPPLTEVFPEVLPLAHASCFEVESETEFTLEALASRFPSSEDATSHLRGWGWQASADRAFGCDDPPTGEAGYVYISLHRFVNATSAQQAVDYFAASLAEDTTLTHATAPAIGDYAVALSGPAVNGEEFTLYTSSGPLLIRVTGVSPSDIPMENVVAVAEAILTAQQGASQAVTLQPQSAPSGPASAYLPPSPAVSHTECFSILSEGPYSYSDVASALQTWGLTQSEIDALGWQDGAYRGFTCADPPSGRATQIDVVIHRFRDAQSAQQARLYFAGTYGLGTNEVRSCETAGSLVICVTAISVSGSPLSDMQFVLLQVLDAAGG